MLMRSTFAVVASLLTCAPLIAAPPPEPSSTLGDSLQATTSAFQSWQQKIGDIGCWTDIHVVDEWRIQSHAEEDRCQLLDADNQFVCAGSRIDCERALAKAVADGKAKEAKGTVVVLLHGLGKSRNDMIPLRDYLTENSDFQMVTMSYASTKATIDDHARALGEIVFNLKEATEVHFVAHSMGNLVLRRLLKMIETDDFPDLKPRLGRIVMLAPPNQGARLAVVFEDNPIFKAIGASVDQLTEDNWKETKKRLATPRTDFGIVAGASGAYGSPLIPGKDDWIVSVEETKLAGAADFWLTKMDHRRVLHAQSIQSGVLKFLKHGYFLSAKQRHPLK
jgi:predicted alpha/beta hydrolase family esterase